MQYKVKQLIYTTFLLLIEMIYRKGLCRNPPKMTKNSVIFRGGYDKGYKIFIADENLFVCILIYFNKSIHFQ